MASIKWVMGMFFINLHTLVTFYRLKLTQVREQCELNELRTKTDEVGRQGQKMQELESIISGKETEMKSQQRGTIHICLSYNKKLTFSNVIAK